MEDRDVLERVLAAGDEKPTNFSLALLQNITDNFSEERKIGEGGFGKVYMGVLRNGNVAVKRIEVNINTLDDKMFFREFNSLMQVINHQNVVRFLGFCHNTEGEAIKETGTENFVLAQKRERLLCFEYISNGSLDKYITDELRGLNWDTRYQIIMGICDGLHYLHDKKSIIHMDLKPANILLDGGMIPKITDFGLSRPDENTYTAGERFGTRGYFAPEYKKDGKTSIKSDIYSLGVIITELVAGCKVVPDNNNVLRRWRHRWKKPPTIQQYQQLTKCLEIAECCSKQKPEDRPSICDIIVSFSETESTNVHISQISPSLDDDDMLRIEPLELRFAFELNKETSIAVELTNETGKCVAFNIKTLSQLPYCTQPNKGIVVPRSKRIVKITLQAQETTPGLMPRADEFIVQSTKLEDDAGGTDENIREHMFNNEAGKVVDEVSVTVVYDESKKAQVVQSLDLVAEPNVPISEEITSSSYKDVRGQTKSQRLNFHPLQIISSTNVSCRYTTSDRAAVDLMTGAMGSLLPKLGQLLNEEHNLEEDVMEGIESLEEQLTDMYTALCNVSQEQLHKLDLQDKRWANKVRDLSYDIEDMINDLLIRIECSEPITNQDSFGRLIQKMLNRVRKVADRSKEVKLSPSVANNQASTSIDDDPRILDWYKDHKELVGIDGPRDELAKRLTSGDDGAPKQELKIISIYGDGGLGKTTLVKAVYNILAMEFVRKAFVPVGRNPDIKRVLMDILFELDKDTYSNIHNEKWGKRHLIDKLQNELTKKRYLIVIDDIWDIDSWENIKHALVDNGNGSRVITTSRNYDVAENSGEVCKLEPLSDHHSKKLFYARLMGKGTSAFDQPDVQSTEYILGKCGGLPLAIITIASLLDGKPVEDWPEVYKRIGFGHDDTRAVNTKKILLFSYNDLPSHLKTCLLYLSIFPEDQVIDKNTLVWKWIAEGFVHEEQGDTLFKVGERYFNELINRSIIQPVQHNETWFGQYTEKYTIYGCQVHDMMLDLICYMAKEENFVTTLDNDEQHLASQNNARILAVRNRVLKQQDLANTRKLKVMRSFNAAMCDLSLMPLDSLLLSFQVLHVLSLKNCDIPGSLDSLEECEISRDQSYRLKNFAGLRHLRYLGLRRTDISEFPMELGELRSLQILHLDTKIQELPQSLTLLRKLKCLRCDFPVKLTYGMGSLTSLEELRLYLDFDPNSDYSPAPELADFVKELGKLTELRVLYITTVRFPHCLDEALVESSNKLKKMEDLDIDVYVPNNNHNSWHGYSPCGSLRHLRLCNSEVPAWMNASLRYICSLNLRVTSVKMGFLYNLGSLPELRTLMLWISDDNNFHDVVGTGAFPKLRFFKTNFLVTYLQGAMPCLESLEFFVNSPANAVGSHFHYLQNLPSLEKITARMQWLHAKTVEGKAVIAAVRRAVDKHRNRPILFIEQKWY